MTTPQIHFIIALIGFALSHSVLANARLKATLFAWKPNLAKYYRLLFNLFSAVSLGVVYLFLPPSKLIYSVPFPYAFANIALMIWAFWNAYIALKTMGTATFLGIRQLKAKPENLTLDEWVEPKLVTTGWFSKVRHPLYFFSLVALFAMPRMTDTWLIISIFSALYFFFGRLPEEKRLEEQFGEEYKKYKSQTPALLPIPWKKG